MANRDLPDPGQVIEKFQSTTQSGVNDNFEFTTESDGLTKITPTTILSRAILLSASDILTSNSIPIELIPAPGAGKQIVPHRLHLFYKFNTIPFYVAPSTGYFGAFFNIDHPLFGSGSNLITSNDSAMIVDFFTANNYIDCSGLRNYQTSTAFAENASDIDNYGTTYFPESAALFLFSPNDFMDGGAPATITITDGSFGWIAGQLAAGDNANGYPNCPSAEIASYTVNAVDSAGTATMVVVTTPGQIVYSVTATGLVARGPAKAIVSASTSGSSITITGNYTSYFIAGTQFSVAGGPIGTESFTTASSSFVGGNTIIITTVAPSVDTTTGFVVGVSDFVYPIIAVNQGTKTWTIAGDHTADPIGGTGFVWSARNSTGNDGMYSTASCTTSLGNTLLVSNEAIPSAVADGQIVQATSGIISLTFDIGTVTFGNGTMQATVWYSIINLP